MGEAGKDASQVECDRTIKMELHGTRVSSVISLFRHRDLDGTVGLTALMAAGLFGLHISSDGRMTRTSSSARWA